MKLKLFAYGAAAVIALSANQSEVFAGQVTLAPAERVVMEVGAKRQVKNLVNGSERTSTVSRLDENTMKWEVSNGCWGTSVTDDRFAPSLSWNKCSDSPEWHSGTVNIKSKDGNIWPLQIGNKVKYEYTSRSHRGNTSDNYRECEVTGAVQVEAAGKSYDAYEVECNERSRKRTFYYAPEQQRVVLQKNYHKRRNSTEVTEFVEVIN